MDRDAPQLRLRLRVETEGRPPVFCHADIYRGDLHRLGIGDGHCGFSVSVGEFTAGHRFRVLVAGTGQPLHPDPFVIRAPAPPRTGRAGTIAFGLDPTPLGGTRVSGWAQDMADPRRPLRVELRVGRGRDASARAVRASLYRPDRIGRDPHPFSGFVLPRSGPAAREALVDMETGAELARLT